MQRQIHLRVLIADDNEIARSMITEQLKVIGHDVVGEARNGNEAVELVMALEPDVAIFDIKMPDRDGLDGAREIIRRKPMPILILTAFDDDELIERAADIGIFAYLVKPASLQMLRTSVDLAIARFEELQEARKESKDLKEALETRKIVERAKGVLMERLKLSETDALRQLQREASRQSKPIRQIAEMFLIAEGILKR